ncbi:sugar-binding domain-containing protein [Gottfriedia sp. NPDC057991]|uniref:sugar-binding domain-containing protein n=1 Tax=Gottfriedia sp. NPDC057991 TaxID=3346298 RepID=UPI0036DF9A83
MGGIYLDATIIQEEKMTMYELTFIKHPNAASNILGQFYDQNGKIIDLPHQKRLIGTDLKSLRVLNVIAVASVEKKIEAIYRALKGKYITVLITDEATAISLLNMEVK